MRRIFCMLFLIALLPVIGLWAGPKRMVDLVYFSYNRPLQLYALLESTEQYFTNINELHVVYRASSDAYAKAYDELFLRFPQVKPHRQSDSPEKDFKPLTLASVFSESSRCPYVMFAVDDMIVTDHVDLAVCTKAMDRWKAYGFYLRLGQNITFCYMENRASPLPPGKVVEGGCFLWRFRDATGGDWRYPNTTDMTIYRKKAIAPHLKELDYINPNTFESLWDQRKDLDQYGICFEYSKNINLPMNIVTTFRNRHAHLYSVKRLLTLFQRGKKIDIRTFHQVRNPSPHVPYKPRFVRRSN